MTWPPKIPWWVPVVAIAVAVLAVVWALNRGRTAASELAREREERALELAGLSVAHQVERDALLADLFVEAKASAALAEELARIQAAAPGTKPVATAHGSTPWKPVGPAAGTAPASPPAAGVPSPSVPASSCPPCRLWVGDEVQVRASGAALETDAGNYVVGAAASVWRRPAGGGEEERLHDERLRLEVKVEEQGAGPGWGGGPLVGAFGGPGGGTWILGGLVATPSVRLLLGVEGSLVAGGGVGPNGGGGGFLSALFR